MQYAVDTLADGFDLGGIGKVGSFERFRCAEAGRGFHVAEHQIRIDRRQQLAQPRADFPGSAGHQYAWHFIPHFCILLSMAQLDCRNKLPVILRSSPSWASLEGWPHAPVLAAILRDAAQARGSSG